MAAGKLHFKSDAGGITSVSREAGATNGELVLPVSGTVASVDTGVTYNAIARYDSITGKLQNSAITIDDSGNIGSGTQSFNGFGGTGFKNHIINGNFDVWQRGASHTTNATINYGSADRWRTVNLETTNLVSTRQEVSGVVPFQAKYFIRQTVPLNTATGTVLDQLIEGLRQFSNKVVTLSMWVKGTAGKKIGIGLQTSYGTGGSPSTDESIVGSVYTLSGVWEKISITRTLPDFINGKTYGTNGNDNLRVLILTQTGSTNSTPEIFFQSGTFDIAQVQLEEGSVATPFENRPYGLELSLCQRYYWQMRSANGIVGTSTAVFRMNAKNPVIMRTSPSISLSGAMNVQLGSASGGALTAIGTTYNTIECVEFDAVVPSTAASLGSSAVLLAQNSNYIAVAAEL